LALLPQMAIVIVVLLRSFAVRPHY
jgi:hypothetical protein